MKRLLPTKCGEERKKRNILGDDWHPCIFLLFLWCSSRRSDARNCGLTLWLMQQSGDMRLSLPANHLAGGSIINLSVNHSSHSLWCRTSVRGSEADMHWLYVQLWHFTPCSAASWWVVSAGAASGFLLHASLHYGGEIRVGEMRLCHVLQAKVWGISWALEQDIV